MTNDSLASFDLRFSGAVVDALLYCFPMAIAYSSDNVLFDLAAGVLLLLVFVMQAVFLTRKGQSVGKIAFGTKIVRFGTGEEGGFHHNVLLRVVVNGVLSLIPFYPLVDILFIFRPGKRCLHDLIAGTEVIAIKSSEPGRASDGVEGNASG